MKLPEQPMLSPELLLNVVESLKLPLLNISRQAETAERGNAELASIQASAQSALQLLDNYALGLRLKLEPQSLQLEPVSIASVLYDTGQQLSAMAKNYGVTLELNIAGKFGPVTAHRQALQAALTSLGAALIEALPASDHRQLRLQLATHRCRYGIVAGLYTDSQGPMRQRSLNKGHRLLAHRQALPQLTHTSGSGFFIAESLLAAQQLTLTASRHHRLFGWGAVLKPNNQLQLV